MAVCSPGDFTVSDATTIASKDTNRLLPQRILESVVRKSAYKDIFEVGSIGNESDVMRSVVQGRAYMGTSLVKPAFVRDTDMCGVPGNKDQVGNYEHPLELETYRGRGPDICVNKGRTRFAKTYATSEATLRDGIMALDNADMRYVSMYGSGLKFVVKAGSNNFDNMLSGSEQVPNAKFGSNWSASVADRLPTGPATFAIIREIVSTMIHDFFLDTWDENGMIAKLIGSDWIIERFRNELGVKEDLIAMVNGKYDIGKKAIDGFAWKGPYREVGFGKDYQPLRFNALDANGDPVFIEPEIPTAGTNGVVATVNPDWKKAKYEILMVYLPNSFKLLRPKNHNESGDGIVKFDPKNYTGDLKWHYVVDNQCNQDGDFGWHKYSLSRAWEIMRPHAACAVAYKRCDFDLGVSSCTFNTGTGTGTGT